MEIHSLGPAHEAIWAAVEWPYGEEPTISAIGWHVPLWGDVDLEALGELSMSRLVVVSNRVPSFSSESNAGGLAVALGAALEESGGLWFGWSGNVAEAAGSVATVVDGDAFALATVDLSRAELRGYYEEFANRALWPLFHGRLDLARFDHDSHAMYRQVNRRFADALHPLIETDDTVWVHDYHLIPLGAELRRLGVSGPLGFFLHIPFPTSQTLAALPWLSELVESLCSYDLIGFQTTKCLRNFRAVVTQQLGGSVADDGTVSIGGRSAKAGVFPVGIDTSAFKALAGSPATQRRVERLRQTVGDQDWIVGVDRLDYTKGLAERFRAFEALLERGAHLHGRVCLVQIAAPSREAIAEYQAIQGELESLVGKINGQFGRLNWTPLRYLNKCFNHTQLAALYRVCRVGLVTPLCDGMNLVAKEYMAAQDPKNPGVLVLSRFAGAAQELTDALLVNPYDASATAEAIERALEMPLAERRKRWESMMHRLETNDVHRWRHDFLEALESACFHKSDTRTARAA